MLFTDIEIDEPIDKVVDDWDFLNERVIQRYMGKFVPTGDSVIGVRRTVPSLEDGGRPLDMVPTRRNFEIGPNGVVQVAREPLTVHVTASGTPHHTEHLFGYWHINDKDEIILPLPPVSDERPAHLLIIMGRPTGKETDRIAFYCERCTALVFMRELITGNYAFQHFWRWERESVDEYNSSEQNRTCPECGHVNFHGYTAFPTQDDENMRKARRAW
jgi:ribosomal protein S27AE